MDQHHRPAVLPHTKSKGLQDERHRPAVLPHTKSKPFHLLSRHDHSEGVQQEELHAIASAYLRKWIKQSSFIVGSDSEVEYDAGDDESSYVISSCNGDVAHDNSTLDPPSPDTLPHIASSSGTYPLKQLWTRHVAPLARTSHRSSGRSKNDEQSIASCPPRRDHRESVGLYTRNEISSTPSNSKDDTHRVDSVMMRSPEEKRDGQVQNEAALVTTRNIRCATSPLISSFSTVRSDLSEEQLSLQLWQQEQNRQCTYLPHLKLGDRGSPQDMLQVKHEGTSLASSSDCDDDDDDDENIKFTKAMDLLQLHDFAFVLRSDGISWTYAIVADRQPDSILFVTDTEGSTKVISKKRWRVSILFVNPDAVEDCCEEPKTKDQG